MDNTKINYRKIDSSDIDLFVKYRIQFLIELQGDLINHNSIYDQRYIGVESPKKLEELLKNGLTDYFKNAIQSNEFIGVIAEYENKPIGFGGMVIQTIPGHFLHITGKQGYILSMYTIPEFRGNGICTDLLKLLIDEAKKLKLGKLTLHASEQGIEIYKKAGFTEPLLPELELKLK